jgi:NADH-quinone oxidoreductase subunit J
MRLIVNEHGQPEKHLMEVQTVFFYLFSLVLLVSAFRVITARNPVHAVLYLILAFSQAAGIWMLLKAEFLSIVLVLVYLGAVMVLFLFVVMMLDIRFEGVRRDFWRYLPWALLIGALVALEMAAVLFKGFRHSQTAIMPEVKSIAASGAGEYSNTHSLGLLLYTKYLYEVEVAAVLLLVAMIAAIALALRERKDNRKIDASQQVHVRASDRLEIVKIAPTAAPLSTPAPQTQSAPAAPVEKKA